MYPLSSPPLMNFTKLLLFRGDWTRGFTVNHFFQIWLDSCNVRQKTVIILRTIKQFLATYGKPEIFNTVNGSEFLNVNLKTYHEKLLYYIRSSSYTSMQKMAPVQKKDTRWEKKCHPQKSLSHNIKLYDFY